MRKRLILILTLAFAVGITSAAYAEVQNVKVSGDLTVYGLMRNLDVAHNEATADEQGMISIARLRVDADLTDNVAATVRLLNERYWGAQDESAANTDIDLDLVYVSLKEFLYQPLTMIVGRQELRYGNAMIVGDVDTNNVANAASALGGTAGDPDLSARKAFDAIRLILNYDPLVIDLVASKIEEDTKSLSDDVNLYGVNANYALNKETNLEGYYWLKDYGRKKTTNIPKGQKTNVIGGRVVNTSINNLTAQLEAAYQFGTYRSDNAARPTVDRKAWALETGLTYNMPKVKFSPSLSALYAYFRGERDDYSENSGAYRGWDPMFEDQKFGDIANAQFDQTNVHIVGIVATAKPLDAVTLKGEYYAYWWDKPYPAGATVTTRRGNAVTATTEKFAAHEVDITATYDYTEDVQFSLLTGIAVPGPAFTKESRRTATEVIGSMKVTF